MKKILTIPMLLLAGMLFADPINYLDPSGSLAGTASVDGSITTYRDVSGRILGSSFKNGPQIIFRTADGHVVGTATPSGSNTIYRDARGRICGTAASDGKQITFRDKNSRIIGTATPSGSKTTYRNAGGKILGWVDCGENNDFTRDAFIQFAFASGSNFRSVFFE